MTKFLSLLMDCFTRNLDIKHSRFSWTFNATKLFVISQMMLPESDYAQAIRPCPIDFFRQEL